MTILSRWRCWWHRPFGHPDEMIEYVDSLNTVLTNTQSFAGDLTSLAGEGADEDFVNQIKDLGTAAGDALAKQLLAAGPQFRTSPPLDGEEAGEFIYLLLQLLQSLVATRQGNTQIELSCGEHQQDEDNHHQQLSQGVDKAWPDIDAGAPRSAAGREGHCSACHPS